MIKFKLNKRNIILKELSLKDYSKKYENWLNNKNVNKYLFTKSANKNKILKYIQSNLNNPNNLLCGIFLDKKHIGNIRLVRDVNKSHSIGLLIGEKHKINNLAVTVINKFCKFIFKKYPIKKIYIGIIKDNIKSLVVFLKAGFKIYDFKIKKKKIIILLYKQKDYK